MGNFFSKKRDLNNFYLPDPYNDCYSQLMILHSNKCIYCKTYFYDRCELNIHCIIKNKNYYKNMN
jgi:hypothetical protein